MDMLSTGISRFVPGQIWIISKDIQETTKDRPYLILSVSNTIVEAAPLTSSNKHQNPMFVTIPRVTMDDVGVSYVAIPRTRTFDYKKLVESRPTYKMTLNPKLLRRCVSMLITCRYLGYFDDVEMQGILDNAIDMYNNMSSIEYFSSPYARYIDNVVTDNTDDESDIEAKDSTEVSSEITTSTPSVNTGWTLEPAYKDYVSNPYITDKECADEVLKRKNMIQKYHIHNEHLIQAMVSPDDNSSISLENFINYYQYVCGIKLSENTVIRCLAKIGIEVTSDGTIMFAKLKNDGKLKEHGKTEVVNYATKFGNQITAKIYGVKATSVATYRYRNN